MVGTMLESSAPNDFVRIIGDKAYHKDQLREFISDGLCFKVQ